MTSIHTLPFTVNLFELSSKMVGRVALPFPLWHHRQMFYTSPSTWGCTSHARCSPVARERSACQWWVSGRWSPAKISVKRKWCQTGDTSCLVSIHVVGIQVYWNQMNDTHTQPGSPNFQLQLSEELSSGHIAWPHINVTRQLLNSLGPKFSSQGHFHSLQLLNIPQFLFCRLVRLKTAPRGNFSHA